MRELNGFIKLNRNIKNWEWYDDIPVKTVFIHLLLSAFYSECDWHGIRVSAGQVVTSYNSLTKELNLSTQQVRGAINKLKRTGEITVKATNKFSLVTIVNWDKYQNSENLSANKTTFNEQSGNNRGTFKQQQYRNNYNKYKKKNDYSDTKPSFDIEEFESRAIPLPVYTRGEKSKGI